MENFRKRPSIRTAKNLNCSVPRCHNNEFLGSRALAFIREELGTGTMLNMADFRRGVAVLC